MQEVIIGLVELVVIVMVVVVALVGKIKNHKTNIILEHFYIG